MDWFRQNKIKELPLFTALQEKRDGVIILPLYQRDAVWSEGRICTLWDSLLRGFPLPSFLLVQGKGYGKHFQDTRLGPHGRTVTPQGEYYDLLDGQQRLAAIDAITWDEKKPMRLWLDLAPGKEPHPLKFKYWLHACTRVFPFGFRMEADGEHDFAVLRDHDIATLWQRLQESEFKGKEFYELPLAMTRPYKARCPVPLDELVHLIHSTQQKVEYDALREAILRLAEVWKQEDLFPQERREPDEITIDQVARGLLRLQTYTLTFQLLSYEDVDDDEDDYTLYERIGRGGVQITQRQLAVAKLMLELGKDGNDVIAAFQSSEKLQHLLETEDVIHALARVAFAATEPAKDEDLLELTPQRLKTLQKDTTKWSKFIEALRGYCRPSKKAPHLSRLQHAFEQLYTSLRYGADNPYGVPFVQLAQPAKTGEGIAPITLHPLVYWYLMCADGEPADPRHREGIREDMLRWVLFANGFTRRPQHPKLNSQVFQSVVDAERLDFTVVKSLVFQDEKLCEELGFHWQVSMVENGGMVQREYRCTDIPQPDEVTCRTARRLILQNWSTSGINWFLLMWNQREALERLYGAIDYRPALFSKGRPFDADHIVARSRFLYVGIDNDEIRCGLKAIIESEHGFQSVTQMQSEVKDIRLAEGCFRKDLPNTIANYRYWPKRLNRINQAQPVVRKMSAAWVQDQIANDPLRDRFPQSFGDDQLWAWSALPKEDEPLWMQLPPQQWSEDPIGAFTLVTLKREHFLYTNAYRFLKASPPCVEVRLVEGV